MREEIIRMAREAGIIGGRVLPPACHEGEEAYWVEECSVANLERFAELVAAAERERCAKVCDEKAKRNFPWGSENSDRYHAQADWAERCAAAIRAL